MKKKEKNKMYTRAKSKDKLHVSLLTLEAFFFRRATDCYILIYLFHRYICMYIVGLQMNIRKLFGDYIERHMLLRLNIIYNE